MQTATADPLVGRLLEGRYRILDRIARGGMSTVYAAVDERLDRRVAVKVMSSALSADPAFTDRFAREARAAARLAHVNAVAVYDQGHDTAPGSHHVFLVMELVKGRTLRDLIRERVSERGRFSAAEAVSIMEPVLSALSAAHRAGLVHRDVKPENILLSDDGLVKVADFGLARAIDADAASTRTGLMMGTVAYCAPEQIVHGRCDQRSDVYSAAIVLFELLTGAPPYQGDSAMSVAYQHVHSRVPAPSSRIKQRPSGIPTLIDEIVVAATDSDPTGRPADASAFLAEIADARAQLALPVVPIPPRKRDATPNGRAHPGAPTRTPGPPRTPAGSTTDVMRNRSSGRHDTEIVQQRPAPRADAPPPPIVIPPPKQRRALSPRARRRRRRVIATLAVLLLGGLSVLAGIAGVRWYREWNTHVPKVTGSSVSQATARLKTTGYAVGDNITSEFSETVKKGLIISTDPGPGARLAQGKAVALTVSLGPDLVPVPDLTRMPLSTAETQLQDRGLQFNPAPRIRHSLTIRQGRVITTVPKAGTQIDRDQAIVFVVSSGKPTIDVPSIAPSTPFDQANKALTAAKFKVSRVDEFDDTVPSGDVISVDPSDSATYGSTLTVTVSKGPEFVTIPDFPPLAPLSEVQPALENLHLNVDVQKAFGGVEGRVIKIDPGSGTQVHPGETVTVTIV
ncbi:MAG TPA: Stk1 family PASTA domain-containing Ser/Thr kinase [Jatrophihabitantaceae bacterium]|nr:Stk1 family PASTA domain-containing Ser/Thr kinase [Jatrophihabitantaceae bacterium]